MNLKELDPELFREAVEKMATQFKESFNRDVDRRLEEVKKDIEDVAKWNLPAEMAQLFAQWFSKEAIVFTTSIPDPNPGQYRYDNEGPVCLKFNGYEFELGRHKDLDELHNSRVIVFVVPQKKEPKP